MNDLISRQQAIDVLEERLRANGYSNVALVSELNRSIGYLMRLPSAQPEITEAQVKEYCEKRCLVVLSSDAFHRLKSAQPERKKGFWEWVDDMDYRCSACHKYAYGCLGEVLSGHYKYCPFCGCAMEGEEDDGEEIH